MHSILKQKNIKFSKGAKILIFTLIAFFAGFTSFAQDLILNSDEKPAKDKSDNQTDTTKLRYPIAKSGLTSQNDIKQSHPIDIREGNDYQTDVEYDPTTGLYIFHRRVGDMDVATPLAMTTSEYSDYQLKQSMNSYWAEKNRLGGTGGNKFGLDGVEIGLGVAGDKIFGPGGVKLKFQGTVELDFGLSFTKRDNPSISERNRKVTNFDFDTKVQINASGTVGDRINVKLSYNTEATFEADQDLIKLSYQGKEDDIIRKIEVGNVSLPLSSALIPGSNALFGIMTELQYGKLKVSAVVSNQESESETVSSKNGASTTEFEIDITDYDENRHYFLSKYFRDNYDLWMKEIPAIQSDIVITNIDVWVTNTNYSTQNNNTQSTRNIIAFKDLGEPTSKGSWPDNDNWRDYKNIKDKKHPLRTASMIEDVAELSLLKKDEDYAEIKSARKLTTSEYTLNENLGYISLRSALNNGEILAVAYEYRKGGKTYHVGELSSSLSSTMETEAESGSANDAPALYAKLIKTVEVDPNNTDIWDLMMKNVYNIGGYNIQEKDFDLQVKCINSGGLYLDYAKEGEVNAEYKNKKWINVIGADRLNSKQRKMSDGKFDFLEGYTILAAQGRIIFPCVEPFGSHLEKKEIGASSLSFSKLYREIKTDAAEYAEDVKFKIAGEYKSSSGNEIRIKPYAKKGSVRVTAGGRTLEEGTGYTVDYAAGIVRILDEAVLASNSQVNVSSESENMFSSQKTSLMGVNAEYKFSDRLSVGATIMHLSEQPRTLKVANGSEPKSNTIWGINAAYNTQSNWLTKVTDALPLVEAKAPSNFTLSGEFAQLIPGHNKHIEQDGESVAYIDDFEGTESSINLMGANSWVLASVPIRSENDRLSNTFVRSNDSFWSKQDSDSSKYKNVEYGLERAHFAWYQIDNIFQNKKGSSTPDDVTTDDMSTNLVSQVVEQEIYPDKDVVTTEPSTISTLNIAYYPKERGMYNLDVAGMNSKGELENPKQRWGGMMRKLETTNFSKSNIEYLELWILDPYSEGANTVGGVKQSGKLVFNIGEISEDILHDNEINAEERFVQESDNATIWGRKPLGRVTGKFDNDNISVQDVGFNGLSSDQEKEFDTYKKYLSGLSAKGVSNYSDFEKDPAGDDFEHYRKSRFEGKGVLEHYHYYNGVESNSIAEKSGDVETAGKYAPDTEDINGDKTLNTREKYYEYVIDITPDIFSEDTTKWKDTYIVNRQESKESKYSTLPNGNDKNVVWYRLKIPLQDADVNGSDNSSKKGPSFTSIRYMRMYMTDFEETTYLRFAGMNLTRTEWRTINNHGDKSLFAGSDNKYTENIKTNSEAMQISSVSYEKDRGKSPVGYNLPPGIERNQDPTTDTDRRENEQSMRMVINGLKSKETVGAYKRTSLDMRQYERLKMFVHFENGADDPLQSSNGVQFYMRFGTDYTDNYYEYKINNVTFTRKDESSRSAIWPMEIDFAFDDLVQLKMERNKADKAGRASDPTMRYSRAYGSDELTIKGHPSFGDIRTIMVGVINESGETKNMEIWLDELRMSGFNEDGGWAALGKIGFTLSDFASFDATGRIETTGFGGIESNVMDRNLEDTYSLDMSATVQLGKLFPEKAHVNMPLTITHSREKEKPKYDPTNTDVLLKDALEDASDSYRDSLEKISIVSSEQTSFALTNVRVGITSKNPMPYDPANFSFSLAFTKRNERDIDVQYDMTRTYRGNFNYAYSLSPKALMPFKNSKFFKAKKWKLFTDLGFYPMPNSYTFSVNMDRTYNEVMARELNSDPTLMSRSDLISNMTWDKEFNMTRRADIKWNFTKNLKVSFATAMNSEIEETRAFNDQTLDLPRMREYKYNKEYIYDLRTDSISEWAKDLRETTLKSFLSAGEPYNYSQQLNISYAIPVNKIAAFDWITANASYAGNYDWQRGVTLESNTYTSNNDIADSKRSWNGDVRFNMETLYNKSSYLKEVNKKFSKTSLSKKANEKLAAKKDTTQKDDKVVEEPKVKAPKSYERKNLRLKKGNKTRISHRLGVNRIIVNAVDKDGKPYDLKYEIIDQNAINLIAKEDVSNITVTVTEKKRKNEKLGDVLDGIVRGLMMVRNVSGNIRLTEGTTLNGYNKGSGFLGQAGSGEPGAKFTFGFYKAADAIQEAIDKEQLGLDNVVNPIVLTHDQTLQLKATLEPYTGIKFDLNAASSWNKSDEIYYFNETYQKGGEDLFSGSHSHTDIAIRRSSIKRGATLSNETFAEFIDNVYQMRSHIGRKVSNVDNATIPLNSADVLVPAFIAAYKGESLDREKDAKLVRRIGKMLPNWKFTLDLLSKAPILKEGFKAFNITHGYKCTYNINSFSKHSDWEPLVENDMNGFGIIADDEDKYLVRSTKIDNVNLTEAFNPLVGVNTTLKNSVRLKFEYNKNRTAGLDIPALQIVESYTKGFKIGGGYRIDNFGVIIGFVDKKKKTKVNNDLNLNLDIDFKNTDAFIRKFETIANTIEERSSGMKTVKAEFTAEYVVSQAMKVSFFYDRSVSKPRVSTSYPITTSKFGFKIHLLLTETTSRDN